MKRDRTERTADEAHVFDQTNGVLPADRDAPKRADDAALRNRTVAGAAMLSTKRP